MCIDFLSTVFQHFTAASQSPRDGETSAENSLKFILVLKECSQHFPSLPNWFLMDTVLARNPFSRSLLACYKGELVTCYCNFPLSFSNFVSCTCTLEVTSFSLLSCFPLMLQMRRRFKDGAICVFSTHPNR